MSFLSNENSSLKPSANSAEDFEAVFRKWYPSLCHTAFRIVRDKDKAEDLVQDVFVKMWENRKTIQINISIKSYLFRSCMNAALNDAAKAKKHQHVSAEDAPIAGTHQTEERIEQEDLQKKIDEGLNLLPPACRSVFILSRFEEMSYKEISETLQISIKTVENQMGKALKILREHLKDYLVLLILLLY